MNLSFDQQLWLTVIDKLALGAALVGVGYIANRYLESHKVRQAFASEVARQRLAAITEIWHALGEYEMEAYRASGRGFLEILKELGAAGAKLPDPLPRDAQQILAAISVAKNTAVIRGEAETRILRSIDEHSRPIHDHVDRVRALIAAKRFLVGNDLARTLDEYLSLIHATYRMLGPSPGQMQAYKEAYQQLKKRRTDIEEMSEKVFG
jgi:hypothetical protein